MSYPFIEGLFGLFGDPRTSDPSVQDMRLNPGNTNIILHGGKLLTLAEGAPPIEVDPRSLETRDYLDYGGTITTTFSAHPKLDLFSGEMVSLGYMINGPDGKPEIRYDIINSAVSVRQYIFK